MPRLLLTSAFITSIVLGAASASAACMKPNAEGAVRGRLSIGRFTDAADRPETAFILRLPTAACLDGEDEDERVGSTRAIHVYSANDREQKALRRLIGKTVLVRGKPFARHTAHHHAPIVMEVTGIDVH